MRKGRVSKRRKRGGGRLRRRGEGGRRGRGEKEETRKKGKKKKRIKKRAKGWKGAGNEVDWSAGRMEHSLPLWDLGNYRLERRFGFVLACITTRVAVALNLQAAFATFLVCWSTKCLLDCVLHLHYQLRHLDVSKTNQVITHPLPPPKTCSR
jgi:hypothetical protein